MIQDSPNPMALVYKTFEKKPCLPVHDVRCVVHSWLLGNVPIVFLFVGTIANGLCIPVLLRKTLRSKVIVVLAIAALADTLFLWSFMIGNELTAPVDTVTRDELPTGNKIRLFVLTVSATFSQWTIAVFCVERLLVVLFPLWTKMHLSLKRTLKILIVLFICVSALNGFAMFGYKHFDLTPKGMQYDFTNRTKCVLVSNDFGELCWTMFELLTIVGWLLPLCITGLASAFLVVKFRCCKNRSLRDSRSDPQTHNLIAITVFVILTMIAVVSVHIYELFVDINEPNLTTDIVIASLGLTLICNRTLTCILTLLNGALFRNEFCQMFKDIRTCSCQMWL